MKRTNESCSCHQMKQFMVQSAKEWFLTVFRDMTEVEFKKGKNGALKNKNGTFRYGNNKNARPREVTDADFWLDGEHFLVSFDVLGMHTIYAQKVQIQLEKWHVQFVTKSNDQYWIELCQMGNFLLVTQLCNNNEDEEKYAPKFKTRAEMIHKRLTRCFSSACNEWGLFGLGMELLRGMLGLPSDASRFSNSALRACESHFVSIDQMIEACKNPNEYGFFGKLAPGDDLRRIQHNPGKFLIRIGNERGLTLVLPPENGNEFRKCRIDVNAINDKRTFIYVAPGDVTGHGQRTESLKDLVNWVRDWFKVEPLQHEHLAESYINATSSVIAESGLFEGDIGEVDFELFEGDIDILEEHFKS
jgi:hypothetical protein